MTDNTVTVNVGALSNAIAVAIQQAATGTAQATANVTPVPSQTCAGFSGASQQLSDQRPPSHRSANVILPSYLKRKRKEESSGHCASKRPKPVQVWDRDIVCLPSSHGSVGNIPFPRGKFRTKLGEKGLIGKIRLTSQMSVLEVEDEIRSVFQGPMGGSNDFCFHFLQSTGLGSKTLTLPSVSSSFIWTPQQVARLGNNKQPIYIMADDELACCLDSEDERWEREDEDNKDNLSTERRTTDSDDDFQDFPPWHPTNTNRSESTLAVRLGDSPIDLTADESVTDMLVMQQVADNSRNADPPSSPIAPAYSPLTPPTSLGDIIRSIPHEEGTVAIDVRRKHILSDALKGGRKKKFNPKMMLKVVFVGEGALDYGGPRREFFRLFCKSMENSEYFHGYPRCFFSPYIQGLQNGDYRIIGTYVAMSIAQGGPGFPIFADAVFTYFCTGRTTNFAISTEELPPGIKYLVEQIKGVQSDEELQGIFESPELESVLLETGYNKPLSLLTMEDLDNILLCITDYHCLIKVKASMDQFIDGLISGSVMDSIRNHSLLLKPMFCPSPSQLTADSLKALFQVKFVDPDDPRRATQEQTYVFWGDDLDECEDGDFNCTLEDILIFFTGAERVPVLGFELVPKLSFLESSPLRLLPTASTCSLELRLPTYHHNYITFKEYMSVGLKGCEGFGGV